MAMAVPDTTKTAAAPKKKEYDYGQIKLSLDNCIFPSEMLDETPSMKDGLDRDVENELRRWGCELIQVAGLLLKLPQTAMATGQVILQRFYYIKSVIHHDVETCAMACVFLAAKIEENPRRLRDVINVWDHIKQKVVKHSEIPIPMDYYGTQYLNIKNDVIKSERRILKELGFCVHVKHPHKIIITYLQILEHEKNVALARSAWNYMNDSLRTDVFVRFSPDIIACACIFLAARTVKVNLPMKPAWWLLFDASYDDIEDISSCIMRLYSFKSVKVGKLESMVKNIKEKKKKDKSDKDTPNETDSFTPNHTPNSIPPHVTQINSENNSKPSSKNSSPVEKEKDTQDKRSAAVDYKKMKSESDKAFNREQDINKRKSQSKKSNNKTENNDRGHSRTSSDESTDSEPELPSKKYEREREQYESNKKRHATGSGSDSDKNSRIKVDKTKDRLKDIKLKESNGKYNDKHDNFGKVKRSRSRSPDKRGRSVSPKRKVKYVSEKSKEKNPSKVRHTDKYGNTWR